MFGDTNTLVKILRDIFIIPYQYSDFDEDDNEHCLPLATLDPTGDTGEIVSETKPATVCMNAPLKHVFQLGEDEVRKSREADGTREADQMKEADEIQETREETNAKEEIEAQEKINTAQEQVKEVKEAGQGLDVKDTRIPTSARGKPHIHSSGNEGKEVGKRKSKRELAHDFESELIRSCVRNILQKHIFRAEATRRHPGTRL